MFQLIADKMKKHILVISSIETRGDEGEDDKQTLIQIQEDAKRKAELRLVKVNKLFQHNFHTIYSFFIFL